MAWYQAQNASTTLPTQMNPVAWGKMGQEIGTAMTTERNENAMKKAYADANKRPETEGNKAMQDQLWNLQVELVRLEQYLPVAKMNERKAQEQQPTNDVSQNVSQPVTSSAFPSNLGLAKPNVQGYQPNPMTGYQPSRGKF
jgi:hypothetical protein